MNLENFILSHSQISLLNVIQICSGVLHAFKINHNAGYAFNDLKLQNIMISGKSHGQLKINLIDYGMASQFMQDGQHIANSSVDVFRGNILFASLNQLNYKQTSRRDDLISLFYMMLYLLNDFELPQVRENTEGNDAY